MRRLDTNGDGKVSADEFRADTSRFDLTDRNGDGMFLALAAGGYQLAASEGNALDAKLLALATGSPADTGLLDLSPDDGTENAL